MKFGPCRAAAGEMSASRARWREQRVAAAFAATGQRCALAWSLGLVGVAMVAGFTDAALDDVIDLVLRRWR